MWDGFKECLHEPENWDILIMIKWAAILDHYFISITLHWNVWFHNFSLTQHVVMWGQAHRLYHRKKSTHRSRTGWVPSSSKLLCLLTCSNLRCVNSKLANWWTQKGQTDSVNTFDNDWTHTVPHLKVDFPVCLLLVLWLEFCYHFVCRYYQVSTSSKQDEEEADDEIEMSIYEKKWIVD